MNRIASLGIAALALGTAVSAVHAQVPIYPYGGPYWIDRGYGAPCGVPPCTDPRIIRREVQRELQREEAARAQGQGAAPVVPRPPPPPTRVEEIRPEYEGASQIREEFRGSGTVR